jgi:apolipoprotein N-acyltransferase
MGGIEYAAFAVWYRTTTWPQSAARPFVVAAAWVAAELARGTLLSGNPWALVGYSQVRFSSLLQTVDVAGIYGPSFLVVAANAALTELWFAGDAAERRRAWRGLASVACVVLLAGGYGGVRLHMPVPAGPDIPVAAVQSDVEVITQWSAEMRRPNLDTHLELTNVARGDVPPRIVFWPESAMTFFVEDDRPARDRIGAALAGAELVAGGPRATDGGPPYYNAAFLLAPDGRLIAAQVKRWLIPFAEYFPFHSIGVLHRRFGSIGELTPGVRLAPLPTTAGRAGVLVCHESLFPEAAAAQVHAGAEYLVNLSNDSWHGGATYSLMAFDVAVVRAVEQRRWLIRASTSGPSGIVDPFGHVVARTAPFARDVVTGSIRSVSMVTPYGRIGDAFAYVCVLTALASVVLTRRSGRRPATRAAASSSTASGR